MGKWTNILKYGGGLVKGTTVGAGAGYLAWQSIVNDKPVVRTVSEVMVGKDTVDKVVETTEGVVGSVSGVVNSAGEAVDGMKQAGSAWSGIGNFINNLSAGNGLSMVGNFFGNLFKGNMSGMSMLGLVASALLIFGRFGWLGKIGGLLMGMMLIGSNCSIGEARQQNLAQQPERDTARRQVESERQPTVEQQNDIPVITRHR